MFRTLIGRINKLSIVQFGFRQALFPFLVAQLSGPSHFASEANEVTVISVIRNGEPWLNTFLSHHRRLGIRHFVVIDNGSTDETIAILLKQPDVTLLKTEAPYHAYENTMKRYLARRFCQNRWCLCVDADELFDFPMSDLIPLSALISYLNENKFNAVITQMLDMFSRTPLSQQEFNNREHPKKTHRYYDISNVTSHTYPFGTVPEPAIKMYHGGIRRTIFGSNNGLTKVSLFMMDGKIKPFAQWHHALNARLADISCLLLHFPFTKAFSEKVSEAVESGRYGYLTTDEYKLYLQELKKNEDILFVTTTAKILASLYELLDNGFLFASEKYRRWVRDRSLGERIG